MIPLILAVDSYSYRFIVTLAWILGKPLTLLFDPLESIVLFLSGASLMQLDDVMN